MLYIIFWFWWHVERSGFVLIIIFNYLLGQYSVIEGKSVLFSRSGCFIYCIANERASRGAARRGASLAVRASEPRRATTPNSVQSAANSECLVL